MTRCPECESDLELDGYELDLGETINCPECAVELKVTNAYISDADGNEVEAGSYATLVPEIGPMVTLSQALNYAPDPDAGRDLNAWTRNEYTITQQKPIGAVEGLVAARMDQYRRPLIDRFGFASATYEDQDYGTIELN